MDGGKTETQQAEQPAESATRVDQFQLQRAKEIMARLEAQEPRAEHQPTFAHVDTGALVWGLVANVFLGFFAFLATGWAAIFSFLHGSDATVVALWSILFTQIVNAICGSVVFRVCYRDTRVERWDLNDHARYNVKIFMGVILAFQVLFLCLQQT